MSTLTRYWDLPPVRVHETTLSLHLVMERVVALLLLLTPRAVPVDRVSERISASLLIPGMHRGVGPNIARACWACVPRAIGSDGAADFTRRGPSANGRESHGAASRAPGGIATHGPTSQTPTKVDYALN